MDKAPKIVEQDSRALKRLENVEKLRTQGLIWSPQVANTQIADTAGNQLSTPLATTPHRNIGTTKSLRLAVFDIPEIDTRLPCSGLPSGCLHEWAMSNQLSSRERGVWHPPLSLIASMLRTSIMQSCQPGLFVWVGKKCWPSIHLLNKTFSDSSYCWEKNSLFISPPNKKKHLWTLLQALRSPAVFAVIGDASGLSAMASRKLQLAAEQGNTLGLLLRPPWELSHSSSAHSKWHLQTIPSKTESLRWNLELLRLRGSLRPSLSNSAKHQDSPHHSNTQQKASSWPYTWEALEWDFIDGTISLRTAETGSLHTAKTGRGADTAQQQQSIA